jgi:hypothetical protein
MALGEPNTLAYCAKPEITNLKMLIGFETRGQCYKTFFVRNLWTFVISLSVCPWQVLPA